MGVCQVLISEMDYSSFVPSEIDGTVFMCSAYHNMNTTKSLFFPSQDVEEDHSGYVSDIGFRVSPLFLPFSKCCKMVRESCSNDCKILVPVLGGAAHLTGKYLRMFCGACSRII